MKDDTVYITHIRECMRHIEDVLFREKEKGR